jgi:hypothetical protein
VRAALVAALALTACETSPTWPTATREAVAIVCVAFLVWRVIRGLWGVEP